MHNLSIFPIKILRDNYVWIIVNKENNHCLVVDPGEAEPVLLTIKNKQLIPVGILLTHHHADHTGGVSELLSHYLVPVYAHTSNKGAFVTQRVEEGDIISFDHMELKATVLSIPGHTLDHVAYLFPEALFCGDTLFSAGCGRVFEGSYEQMLQSLEKIAALPDETQVYCGHEYTLSNLLFAQHVDPDNVSLKDYVARVKIIRDEDQCTLPSLLGLEKKINPFLRCKDIDFIEQLSIQQNRKFNNQIEVFKYIRELKNNF